MKKQKLKIRTSKGITLIALIITIIVLLILAVVTIKLLVDNGIVGRATGAKNKYKVAEEKELIQLAYSDYKMGIPEGGPIIEDRKLLEQYFLGENGQGKIYEDVVEENIHYYDNIYIIEAKFKDNEIIKDASTSMTFLGFGESESGIEVVFILYNNNIWNVTTQYIGSTMGPLITSVNFVTTISNENKNDEELDLLERYFLGEDKTGLDLNTLFDYSLNIGCSGINETLYIKFTNNNTMKDAYDKLSIIAYGRNNNSDYYIIKYNNNFYKIFVDITNYDHFINELPTVKVEFLTSIQKLRDSQLQIKGATVVGDENTGWTITFDKTKNVYTLTQSGKTFSGIDKTEDLALLRKYFLGENGEGKLIEDVCFGGSMNTFWNNYGFKNDSNSIKKANTEILFLDSDYLPWDNGLDFEINNNYIKYNGAIYKVGISKDGRILSVETEYIPTGREGQKVTYSYDGTKENEKGWIILYDYGDTIEIVSPNAMGELSIGRDDEETQNPGDIDKDGTANTDYDKTIYSYNNAVSRLNRYAESQVTNNNKISVRSVGSNPENPELEGGMYTSSDLEKGIYNGIAKDTDNNYKEDFLRMLLWNVEDIHSGNGFMYASRIASSSYGRLRLEIRFGGGAGSCVFTADGSRV